MTIHIRKASPFDAGAMCDLLNEIIADGRYSALTTPLTRAQLSDLLLNADGRSANHVAVDDTEACLGFQWIGPWPGTPPEACEISTFVKVGETGLGIGSRLFEASKLAAQELGYRWINANIRADNESGLTYYQSRGFRPYSSLKDVTLENGQVVDKILKYYDLRD